MENPLCKICRSISFDAMRYTPGFSHHAEARLLQQEADNEKCCPLCSMLWRALYKYRQSTFAEQFLYYTNPVRLLLNPPGSPIDSCSVTRTQPSPMYSVMVVCGAADDLDRLKWKGEEPDGWDLREGDYDPSKGSKVAIAELRLFGRIGDPCAELFRFREVSSDSASEETFSLINKWVRTCESSHESCQVMGHTNLPYRVLDVGPADGSADPHLRIFNDQSQATESSSSSSNHKRYVALSYCWGKEPTLTTTQENLQSMEGGISMSTLPRTIRDAVIITRKLRVRYLWVDALCILQGTDDASRRDWETESPKMADIYSGAYLTIAAALAPNTGNGIFSKRPSPTVVYVTMPYSAACTPEVTGHVSLGFGEGKLHILKEPLYSRAWTLQERILSKRVLSFTTEQIAWECQSALLTESGEDLPVIGSTRLKSGVDIFDWHTIIRDYSMRNLTYENDKLPAISGLAKAQSQRSGDEYIAGLWKSTVLKDLLWVHEHMVVGNKTQRSRPRSFRAPSWSWASVDGNVWFPGRFEEYQKEFCIMLDYQVTASGTNPFGQLVGGWIMLKGGIKQAWIGDKKSYPYIFEFDHDKTGNKIGGAWLDMDGVPGFDPLDVWCMRVRGNMGLILTHEQQTGSHYRRIGVFSLTSDSHQWLGSCEEKTITII